MPRQLTQRAADLPEYDSLLGEIRALLDSGRSEAFQRIDMIRVQTYIAIGKRIIDAELRHRDRADYGRQVISALARDIGFSDSNLYNMIAVARVFAAAPLLERLSWSHLVRLSQVDDAQARQFYIDQIVQHQWSVRVLEQQIASGYYSRSTAGGQLAPAPAPGLPVRAEDVLRTDYTFDIPGLPTGKYTERDLEAGLRANFEVFLKELGPDFFIRDTQRQIVVDSQYHTVDLELYHRGIPAIIVVELKVGAMNNTFANYDRTGSTGGA
jgi:predicted nuclease of restriction endonuclease-like (RecB) superfamily